MLIGNYNFVCTCEGCPEQYDVFDKDGNQVGYVRLRWGGLTAQCPDVGGIYIYSTGIGGGWTGCFQSDDQRMTHLTKIASRIDMFNSEIKCPYCGGIKRLDEYHFDELDHTGRALIECYDCEKDFFVELWDTVVSTHREQGYTVVDRNKLIVREVD